jgi:c-di-GMP-binding flagellar brake protein YcgR
MDSGYKGIDRRKYKRVMAKYLAICKVLEPWDTRTLFWNKEIYSLMLDLSEGGMAFASEYDLPVGSFIHINFALINLLAEGGNRISQIETGGEIKYNVPTGSGERRFGIEFRDLSGEFRGPIKNFVDSTIREKQK